MDGPQIEIAGAAQLPRSDGHSLLRCFRGEGPVGRTELRSELGPQSPWSAENDGAATEPPSRMVRRGSLKLYRARNRASHKLLPSTLLSGTQASPWLAAEYGTETPVLHDLATDPLERTDIWGTDAVPQSLQEELAALAWADGWTAARVTEKCGRLDEDVAIITAWGAELQQAGEDWWGADAALVENVSRL